MLFRSNNRTKNIDICSYKIKIKKTFIPTSINKEDKATLAIQAIIFIGKNNITREDMSKIFSLLEDKDVNKLKKLVRFAPVWISNYLNQYI